MFGVFENVARKDLLWNPLVLATNSVPQLQQNFCGVLEGLRMLYLTLLKWT